MPFSCKFCDSRFGTKGSLARHIEAWHENTIWKCYICEDVFNSKSALDKHKDKHLKKKPSKLTPKFIKD